VFSRRSGGVDGVGCHPDAIAATARRSRVDHVKNKDAVTKPVLRRLDGLLVVPAALGLHHSNR
jgi:hypothetical protein